MWLEVCALYASEIKQDKERAATGSRVGSLCASKKKWDRERVGIGLTVCALCASEIKHDKERAATGSRLCSLCVSKKKWDRERVGMGSGLCNLWDFQCSQIRKWQPK